MIVYQHLFKRFSFLIFIEEIIYFISSPSPSFSLRSSFPKSEDWSSYFFGCLRFLSSFEAFLSKKTALPFVTKVCYKILILLFCFITLYISLYRSFSIWIKLSSNFSSIRALFFLAPSIIPFSSSKRRVARIKYINFLSGSCF